MDYFILIGAVMVLLASPGPGPLALALVGSVHGWRRSLPFYAGIMTAVFVALILVTTGASLMLQARPAVAAALLIASTVYLLWIAWRLAVFEPSISDEEGSGGVTFVDGFVVNIANPKLYAGLTIILTGFVPQSISGMSAEVVTAAITFGCVVVTNGLWLAAGATLQSRAVGARLLTVFRYASTGLLVVLALGSAYAFIASIS